MPDRRVPLESPENGKRRTKGDRSQADDGTVHLSWAGRKWRTQSQHDERAAHKPLPCETVERFDDCRHALVHGDALDLAELLRARGESVDLVYVDPPYASDRDYVAEARLDGPADGRVVRTLAYADTWKKKAGGLGAYLDMLAPRLEALAGLLGPSGTMWVHLDWRAAYLVRVVLDEIMGRDAFRNEIVWRRAPNLGRQATSDQFGRTLDTILVYGNAEAKLVPPTRLDPIAEGAIRWDDEGRPFTSAPRGDYTDASIAKLEREGRVHRTASGRVYIKYFLVPNADGALCRERRVDALWTDVPPLRHAQVSERTGYPTQKPRALLERIITCATNEGGLVVDGFSGSGTTAVAAHALGRRAAIADVSSLAIATARTRLLREGAGFQIMRTEGIARPASFDVSTEVTSVASTGGARELRVRLIAPNEPLAWAIGVTEDGGFRCLWHAERTLSAKPKPAPVDAIVRVDREAFVRVWADDGRVSTVALSRTAASSTHEVRA